jgi:iron complex outermembrane receptor protein
MRGAKPRTVTVAAAVVALTALPMVPVQAADAATRLSVDIAAQPLEAALVELSKQGHLQLVIATGTVPTSTSISLHGSMPLGVALDRLLRGTGLSYRFVGDHTIAIVLSASATRPLSDSLAAPGTTGAPRSGGEGTDASGAGNTRDNTTSKEDQSVHHHGLLVRLAAVLGICVSASASHRACAADTNPGAGNNSDANVNGVLQEVVVTAERREASAQKTPLVMNVLGGDDLINSGATDVVRTAELVPGVHVVPGQLTGAQIAIRGIVNVNVNVGSDPSLAMSVDDVYIARSQAALASFYDVARVELLRGPQGTLYGRNSISGAMNIITNDPGRELGGNAYIDAGSYSARTVEAAINVPLGERMAVRVAGQTVSHDGYEDHYWNQQNDKAGRIKFLTNLSDNATVLLSASYFHQGGIPAINVVTPYVNASDPWNPNATTTRLSDTDNSVYDFSAKLNWDLPVGNLTYIRGFTRFEENVTVPPSFAKIHRWGTSKQDTDEVRLASHARPDASGQFSWVAGLFWYRETQNQFRHVEVPAFGNLIQDAGYPYVFAGSIAAFGQTTYAFKDHWRGTLGLRYTHESKDATGQNDTTQFGVRTSVPTAFVQADNNVSYKLALETDLNPSSLLYASVTTGFHGGGWMDGVQGSNTYKPEQITSFEIGSKNEFLDHRLRLNVGAYYYDYKDFLVGVSNALAPTCACEVNAPKAHAEGLEIEAAFAFTPADRLGINLAYEDTKYSDFIFYYPFFSQIAGGTIVRDPTNAAKILSSDYSGTPFPFVSRWSGNASYLHTFRLGAIGNLSAQVLTQYRSSYPAALGNDPAFVQSGHTKTDVNLTYAAPGGHWTLTAYGRNLEREPAVISVGRGPGPAGPSNPITAAIGQPRTYGVRLQATF